MNFACIFVQLQVFFGLLALIGPKVPLCLLLFNLNLFVHCISWLLFRFISFFKLQHKILSIPCAFLQAVVLFVFKLRFFGISLFLSIFGLLEVWRLVIRQGDSFLDQFEYFGEVNFVVIVLDLVLNQGRNLVFFLQVLVVKIFVQPQVVLIDVAHTFL